MPLTRNLAGGTYSRRKWIYLFLLILFAHPGGTFLGAQDPSIVPPSIKTGEGRLHYSQAMKFREKSLWNGEVLELNLALRFERRNPDILVELGIALGEMKEWR